MNLLMLPSAAVFRPQGHAQPILPALCRVCRYPRIGGWCSRCDLENDGCAS